MCLPSRQIPFSRKKSRAYYIIQTLLEWRTNPRVPYLPLIKVISWRKITGQKRYEWSTQLIQLPWKRTSIRCGEILFSVSVCVWTEQLWMTREDRINRPLSVALSVASRHAPIPQGNERGALQWQKQTQLHPSGIRLTERWREGILNVKATES